LGPVTTATCRAGTSATSHTTSLIRFVVPSSTPFMRLTRTVLRPSAGETADRFSRRLCEGTASTTKSAPSTASAASEVALRLCGSAMPGR
jgi:hypothetical protein